MTSDEDIFDKNIGNNIFSRSMVIRMMKLAREDTVRECANIAISGAKTVFVEKEKEIQFLKQKVSDLSELCKGDCVKHKEEIQKLKDQLETLEESGFVELVNENKKLRDAVNGYLNCPHSSCMDCDARCKKALEGHDG